MQGLSGTGAFDTDADAPREINMRSMSSQTPPTAPDPEPSSHSAPAEDMTRLGVTRNTVALTWVSFFTDLASETIYPILPLFLTSVLGVEKSLIGLIEGIAESTASLLKLFSGWLADRTGKNKFLVGLGYGLSAIGRPFFALAASPWHVLLLRFLDRVGKGIRSAPRDALILAGSPPDRIGRAFGFHRAGDTAGAILGPALAMGLLAAFGGQYAPVFLIASIPGFIAVAVIVFKVKDAPGKHVGAPKLRWHAFDRRMKLFVVAAFVFGLANSSNAFLILRASDLGVPQVWVPLAYLLYNVVYVLVSIPAGILSDRIGRPKVLVAGFLSFALVYAGFAMANAPWHAWALFAAYGLFSGLTEGVQRAWVGDLAPPELRGSAFGLFHFAVGMAALPASLMMGGLWDAFGPGMAFGLDSGLSLVALGIFLLSLIR